ncbi:hypothetical protein GJ744_005410 [Endocarpon pusillum]|uniref:CN hydrolase domain-containing protein n=1 Tax=Endocarpon pusillum TaxID=364733 RepID=A0A8H7A4R9_9EURO|nr:hypothetical protein GJ744_005410 [Endocarpon pusillum]
MSTVLCTSFSKVTLVLASLHARLPNNEQPMRAKQCITTTNKKYVSQLCFFPLLDGEDGDVSASQYLAGNGQVMAICCSVGDEALATFAPQPEVTNLDLQWGNCPFT